MQYKKNAVSVAIALALAAGLSACGDSDDSSSAPDPAPAPAEMSFKRVSSFAVCAQVGSSCETGDATAAEIVAASTDGMTLIYSNSPAGEVGFVDITDPANPKAAGSLKVGGEPTSVSVLGAYALVAVNTSADFVNTAGKLLVVDIATRSVAASIDLGGQPDSIAVSKDGRYIAVVIENERDEDLGDGAPPQSPAGNLTIIDAVGAPTAWTRRTVDLRGLATLYPGDPEPEYVDIGEDNVAVVSMQENNHIVLVDLPTGTVLRHFSAGTAKLAGIDLSDDRPAFISLTQSLEAVLREPDGVAWISKDRFATADEGDLDGGSRGFTIFNRDGTVAFAAGTALERETVRLGHYPDRRSDAKGNEPENVEFGRYGDRDYLFVASERSSLVFVYDLANPLSPQLKQALPAGMGPEGVLAIPSRNLLIAASETDDREILARSALNIYRYGEGSASYPTIRSVDRADGHPIPWGALSGLAAAPANSTRLFGIDDSFYRANRIFGIDITKKPAVIDTELRITDAKGVLAALPVADAATTDRAANFDSLDLAAMINADKTVNLDPEGIAVASDGGYWIASEGAGTVGEAGRPVTSHNLLLKVDAAGVIQRVITLPPSLNAVQLRFGFEGVAESNGKLVVAFQRAWNKEANPRLGIYDLAAGTWRFVFYPLDPVTSPNGGWVGLSDITALGNDRFLVVERDNQAGPDARIKRLYRIDLANAAENSTVAKTLVRDLMPDLRAPGGAIVEKIEGSAVLANGDVYIVNDNDGVNDNSGETLLLNLGKLLN
ncbi:MAG TPA: esterase-like activity of phytase family protein [Quisquiliibacterium sp.]|nr:esterase-like activity of phytase family protein [Quisquiliibacterium sp.]